jgi:hypothetical protein
LQRRLQRSGGKTLQKKPKCIARFGYCLGRSNRVQGWSSHVPGQSDRYLQKNGEAPKKKVRPSFEELLAKCKRKGAAKKRRNQPIGAQGEKAPPRHEKRESTHHQQGNFTYPFVGSVTPCSWYYPCYYSPTDYSSMYMKSYMIQYPIAHQIMINCKDRLLTTTIWSKIMYVLKAR